MNFFRRLFNYLFGKKQITNQCCFSPECLVLTKNGWVKFKDLKEEDFRSIESNLPECQKEEWKARMRELETWRGD